MASDRGAPRKVIGTVISDRMHKTITVAEERRVAHPLYGKFVRQRTKYKAHDEANEARVGDVVEILFTRPLSKTKNWRLVRVVRRAGESGPSGAPSVPDEAEPAASAAPDREAIP
jgi:small subunit ribosomal protein S17